MTLEEWNAAISPQPMLEFLRGRASERRLRLFAVACCHRALDTSTATSSQEHARRDLSTAEQLAEVVTATQPDALSHYYGFYDVFHGSGSTLEWACHAATAPSGWTAAMEVVKTLVDVEWDADDEVWATGCLRDIFPLFHAPAFGPSFRTSTVFSIAQHAYDTRDFAALMPILADALSDAGVPDDSEVMRHCRDGGPHVRGCWVVDLVLGKS